MAWSLGTIPGKWSHSSDAYTESSEQWAQLRPESESRVWCVARIHPCYTDTGITLLCPRHLLHGNHCRTQHTAAHGSQNLSRHHFIRNIVIIMLGEWENVSKQKQFKSFLFYYFHVFLDLWIVKAVFLSIINSELRIVILIQWSNDSLVKLLAQLST